MTHQSDRIKRIGGVILEVVLGVFLVAILVSALRAPESQAGPRKSGSKNLRAANSATGSLLPVQGTICLQDDSNSLNVVLFEPATGNYTFCCNGIVAASGTGLVSLKGGLIQIQDNPATYRVLIKADTATARGVATLQMPVGVVKCTIADRNMNNNTCTCSPLPAGP